MVFSTKNSVKHSFTFVAVVLFFFLAACSKGKTVIDSVALDVQTLPSIHSEDVSCLVSDSGITRNRLTAKVFDLYDSNDPKKSYWYFPKGCYVEQFDSLFNVEGSIEADTVYYYDKKKLWHAIGNVKAMNLQKEKFETQELFWDENLGKIYSSQAIRVEKTDGTVILGKGFESNQAMTDYHIFKTYGIFYISDKDSISSLNN